MPDELNSEQFIDPGRPVPNASESKKEPRGRTEEEIHINFGKVFVDPWWPSSPKTNKNSPKTNKNSPKKNMLSPKKTKNSLKKNKKKYDDDSNNTLREKLWEKSLTKKISIMSQHSLSSRAPSNYTKIHKQPKSLISPMAGSIAEGLSHEKPEKFLLKARGQL
jgi:hypothetical protein